MRCHDTYYHHGVNLQCEANEGHECVHYNGAVWWSNHEGWPDHPPAVDRWHIGWVILSIALGLGFGAILYWIFG